MRMPNPKSVTQFDLLQTVKNRIVKLGPGHWLTRTALLMEAVRRGWSIRFQGDKLEMRKAKRKIILHEREFVNIPMMFWHSEHYFKHIMPKLQGGFEVWDFSKLSEHVYRRGQTSFLTIGLPEEDSIEAYARFYMPKQGEIVWDVGANVGFTSWFLAELVGEDGQVIAFEPDEGNFEILCENLRRHKLNNVIPVLKALDRDSGIKLFNMDHTMTAGIHSYAHYSAGGSLKEVETLSLKDAFLTYGKPSYVKMDIEGAELAVFDGSQDFLNSTDTHWAIETNHLVDGAFTHGRLERLFERAGYQTRTELCEGQWHLWANHVGFAVEKY